MKKLFSLLLIAVLFLTALPVYAEDTTATGNETNPVNTETTVSLTIPVSYTVVVPKTITIDPITKSADTSIIVKNFNASSLSQYIILSVPSSITLGNKSIPVKVAGGNQYSGAGDSTTPSGESKTLSIDASEVSNAGVYTTTLNLKFEYYVDPSGGGGAGNIN